MTSLGTLQHIIDILEQDTELKEIIKDKVYVHIAEENTTFPFLLLKRENLTVTYVKKNVVEDSIDISINIASMTYKQVIQIAELIRKDLELKEDDIIKQCRLLNVTEDYLENAYVQILTFNILS